MENVGEVGLVLGRNQMTRKRETERSQRLRALAEHRNGDDPQPFGRLTPLGHITTHSTELNRLVDLGPIGQRAGGHRPKLRPLDHARSPIRLHEREKHPARGSRMNGQPCARAPSGIDEKRALDAEKIENIITVKD
jgi:hypothetical protein